MIKTKERPNGEGGATRPKVFPVITKHVVNIIS